MKTKLAFSFFIFQLFCGVVFSQWVQISTIPNATLNSVKFFDQNTGVAAGSNGIWRSTNGGFNWVNVLTSTTSLNSLSFGNIDSGFAVGDSGKIFETSTSGVTWEQMNSGTTDNLYHAYSLANSNTYAVGQNGVFLTGYFGVTSWYVRYAATLDLYGIFMLPNNGYQVGFCIGDQNSAYYTITDNGGVNWLSYYTPNAPPLKAYAFLGGNTVVIVGSIGILERTTNFGQSWTQPPSNTTYDLYSVVFADAYTGWLCGLYGFIEQSTNGGVTWHQQFDPNYSDLHSLSFINNLTGWAVGISGVVVRTNNGGLTGFKPISSETPNSTILWQNYPNPFNPTTKIRFTVPLLITEAQSAFVAVKVYDVFGKEVAMLVNETLNAGTFEFEWNASNFASGIYFYALYIDSKLYCVKKMVLSK